MCGVCGVCVCVCVCVCTCVCVCVCVAEVILSQSCSKRVSDERPTSHSGSSVHPVSYYRTKHANKQLHTKAIDSGYEEGSWVEEGQEDGDSKAPHTISLWREDMGGHGKQPRGT